MPAFCKDVSVYMVSTKYPEIHFASTAMNIPPSTFSKDIVLIKLVDFLQFLFFHKAQSVKSSFFFLEKIF